MYLRVVMYGILVEMKLYPLAVCPNCVGLSKFWLSRLKAVIRVVSPPLRLALCEAKQDV